MPSHLPNDKGYSFRNLKYMSQFAKNISWEELRQQVVAQIAWGNLILYH